MASAGTHSRRTRGRRLLVPVLVLGLQPGLWGCQPRSGELRPPPGAPEWQAMYSRAFDDGYSREVVQLTGRAPNDVYDQRLLGARLGYADLVAKVTVQQVWARGRYQGRPQQYLDVEIDEVLMGTVPRGTDDQQLVPIQGAGEVPATLRGQEMIMFLRWAPKASPPYHHHLVPADNQTIGWVRAMIDHAKEQKVLDRRGTERRRAHRKRTKTAE